MRGAFLKCHRHHSDWTPSSCLAPTTPLYILRLTLGYKHYHYIHRPRKVIYYDIPLCMLHEVQIDNEYLWKISRGQTVCRIDWNTTQQQCRLDNDRLRYNTTSVHNPCKTNLLEVRSLFRHMENGTSCCMCCSKSTSLALQSQFSTPSCTFHISQ